MSLPPLPHYITDYGHGIHAIDSGFGRPHFDAIHVVIENGRAAIIDTATNSSVPRLLVALETLEIRPWQVDYVMLSHIHLDHAGSAGSLMALMADARLVVHPRGARHMADPTKLIAGTIGVYGEEETRRMYGDILPIPAERIIEAQHLQTLDLAGRELLLLDTAGHSRHHICIRDGRSGHIFAGDTFGISYPELNNQGRQFIFPTTTPVQFDPDALHQSVNLLLNYKPEAIYVTHYSQVTDIPRLGADLHRQIDLQVAMALRERSGSGERHQRLHAGMAKIVQDEAAQHSWGLSGEPLLELMETDIELNAQGLGSWLDTLEG